VESRDDGAFEFAAVEQGDWRLSAEIGDDDEMPLGGVGSALVSDKDVENVQIRLAAPFAVEVGANWGSVQAPALGERAPNLLSLTPVEAQPALNLDPAKNIGAIFGLFPGRYRVIIPATVGLDTYVAAVMWGGRDVAGKVVDLTPGAAPFQVIYKPGLGKVRGTVEKGEGASVLLVPREAGEVSIIRTTSCGAGGAFEINEAVPGDYYVVAFDRSDIGGLPWDMLFSAILPIASGVRVESGATASENLRVSKWPW
jgi:hypothetical protein